VPIRLRRRLVVLGLLAPTAVACHRRTAPLPDLPAAIATRECGPTDGPAVVLQFARTPAAAAAVPPPPPALQVSIWQPLAALSGRTWRIAAGGTAQGSGARWHAAPDPPIAAAGTVTVEAVTTDQTVIGRLDLRFADDTQLRQAFRAAWVERAVLCG